jgi:hypothetical protein
MASTLLPWLVGGGLLLLSGLAVAAPSAPARPTRPTLAWVKMQMASYGYPLPAVGQSYIVGIPRRTTDGTRTPKDPWDDWIGVLKNVGEGRFIWQYAVGTCDPGWAPMFGKGKYPTVPEGASRLTAPQFSPNAYGGGYHHHRTDRPAFRQVGVVQIDLFNRSTRRWRGPINSRAYQNFHTTGGLGIDWRRIQEEGVGDHSHGCLVALVPEEHRQMLKLGGWTPDINGVRLGVVMLPWDDRGVA